MLGYSFCRLAQGLSIGEVLWPPAATLDATRSAAEIEFAVSSLCGSTIPSTRLSQAASKSTPSMVGSISMACGSFPNRKKIFGLESSSTWIFSSGAPKAASAAYAAFAFSGSAFMKRSIPGKAGLRVKDYRIAANDQVLNAVRVEGGQKVFVVLVYPAPSSNPSARTQFRSTLQPHPSAPTPDGFASTDTRRPSSPRDCYRRERFYPSLPPAYSTNLINSIG
jgi:hypothetical protein